MNPSSIISGLVADLTLADAVVESANSSDNHGFVCAALNSRRVSVDIFDDGGVLVAQCIAGEGEQIDPTDEVRVVEAGPGLISDVLPMLRAVAT